MTPQANPFSHLQGSLIRVTPSGSYFKSKGILEPQFTALLVKTPLSSTRAEEGFNSLFLYNGSLYEFNLYHNEVSALP
jgi:hypothetical protein